MSRLPFQRMPFRTKLTMLVTTATGIALLFVVAALVVTSFFQMRQRLLDEAAIQAAVCANNSTAALSFDDVDTAQEVLESLTADPRVILARTYRGDELFAEFLHRSPTGQPPVVMPPADADHAFAGRRLTVTHPIGRGGETIGRVLVVYDLTDLTTRLLIQIGIVVGAATAALLLSLLLTRQLKRDLEEPVRHLAETADRVSRERDYTLRATRITEDELGDLTDSFNEMLGEIQTRDDALSRYGEELEARIRTRTADLEDARAQAELASRAKSDFLANMSHEIRSPMTAILGYAEILHDQPVPAGAPGSGADPQRREAVESIRRNSEHLLAVINDILDLSKLESGRMTVERVLCDPQLTADEVVRLMKGRAEEKGLELTLETAGPMPRQILTDPTRLRQILLNLVGNAIKFTAQGGVRIVLRILPPSAEEPQLAIDVLDTGVGIPDEKIELLFEPFAQADESTTRRYGGTGLGLTISRRFAQMLGGSLTADSKPGHGSRFTVTVDTGDLTDVPFTTEMPAASDATSDVAPPDLAGRRILVAEDTLDNQRLLAHHLGQTGADVEIVGDGRTAVTRILAETARPFDVVLMDMQMPELDGYDASRMLREKGWTPPIIAITAHAMHGDRERCLEAGMDDYITKPINRSALYTAIARACGVTLEPATKVTSATSATAHATASDVIDAAGLLERCHGSTSLRDELIEIFLTTCDERMDELHAAVHDGEADQVRRHAHALKGTLATVGADTAAAAAARLESLAGDNGQSDLATAIAALDDAIRAAKPALAALRN